LISIVATLQKIQGCNNTCDEGGSWTWITRLWSHGHYKNGVL